MKFRGGEFSTGTMRNFQPELTKTNVLDDHFIDHGALSRWPAKLSADCRHF